MFAFDTPLLPSLFIHALLGSGLGPNRSQVDSHHGLACHQQLPTTPKGSEAWRLILSCTILYVFLYKDYFSKIDFIAQRQERTYEDANVEEHCVLEAQGPWHPWYDAKKICCSVSHRTWMHWRQQWRNCLQKDGPLIRQAQSHVGSIDQNSSSCA